eukprot:5677664-Pyramimonas_sp.AAC.1
MDPRGGGRTAGAEGADENAEAERTREGYSPCWRGGLGQRQRLLAAVAMGAVARVRPVAVGPAVGRAIGRAAVQVAGQRRRQVAAARQQ